LNRALDQPAGWSSRHAVEADRDRLEGRM